MIESNSFNRRQFMISATLLAGGLVVGCRTTRGSGVYDANADGKPVFTPNAWVHIKADGQVILILDRVEMGQGTMTAHATIIAEELGVNAQLVKVEFAPPGAAYINPLLGGQITGASSSTPSSWQPLRLAGAAAREMLTEGGAQKLGVPLAECICEGGSIVHKPSGKSVGFGAIAAFTAENIKVPDRPQVKDFSTFRQLGKSVKRLDSKAKVLGQATYGIDMKLADMLVAVIVRAPAQGARILSFDDSKAKAYWAAEQAEGFVIPTSRGVAVVSSNYWLAKSAASRIEARFSEGEAPTFDGDLAALARARGVDRDAGPMLVVDRIGDAAAAHAAAGRSIEASYELPFLPHQTLEPQNCTAHFKNGRLEIWAPCQAAGNALSAAARATGLKEEDITFHTTYIGGGFGRRLAVDYVHEAAEIAKALSKPVKVMWTREDDTRHDYYRPGMLHVMKASLNSDKKIASWSQRIVGQSILAAFGKPIPLGPLPQRGLGSDEGAKDQVAVTPPGVPSLDNFVIEGAEKIPYEMGARLVQYRALETGVKVGFWRSVGHSHTGFAIESFMNELAIAADIDALQFRRRLLTGKSRELAVLEKAAAMANWGTEPAKPSQGTRTLGIAMHCCFSSYCAQVVQILLVGNTVTVEKVWCAIDVGFALNPDIIVAQSEGSIIYGLSAALKQNITMKNGAVEQSNFNNCPILRYNESPEIFVSLVGSTDSTVPPTGVGEVAVPALAPALCHAIFRASGKIYRKMPIPLATGKVRASNTAGVGTGAGSTVDPELRQAAQDAIDSNCGPCHNAPAEEGGISNVGDLNALEKSRGTRRRYKMIVGQSMPPPTEENGQFISPISAQDKSAIFKWIDAVAKARGE